MPESSYEQALKTLEKTFENRIRRASGENDTKSGALASVLPLHAGEVDAHGLRGSSGCWGH
jgi:hypothetical protein